MKLSRFLAIVGPGLLVAATGVGTADLATGSIAGSMLGTAILWAVVIGAFLKFVITEGVARWQLSSGMSVLAGAAAHLGRLPMLLFLPYLLLWSFFTASAMMSGCGVTLHALIPLFDDPQHGKVFFGILSSIVGLILVHIGGYRLFERIMTVCILAMFATVVLTAILLWPGTGQVLTGLLIPTIPDFHGAGLTWTVALIGGVGGTVTVLCYGYWIREEGRTDGDDLGICRIDIGTGYLMTALFGLSIVIIGSRLDLSGSGAMLLVQLSDELREPLGLFGKYMFLVGAAGAVFSSLLGVWQATPYIFEDSWSLFRNPPEKGEAPRAPATTNSPLYRYYLLALAIVPIVGLFTSFRNVVTIYAVVGAFFVPMLALVLLFLNSGRWIDARFRNGLATSAALILTVAFFLYVAAQKIIA
jgi:Mn2+/Fe2+ NRAMP family transporter